MVNKKCRHDTFEKVADGVLRCSCGKSWLKTTTRHSDKQVYHSAKYRCD